MTRKELLAAAEKCVCGQREQEYGTPEDNFGRIADMWGAYLGYPIRPEDVAAMMALLKIARIATSTATADSWIDLAGYAACGAEVSGEDAVKEISFKVDGAELAREVLNDNLG